MTEIFDFRDREVPDRLVEALHRAAALGPVDVDCRGATFLSHVEFDRVEFRRLWAQGVTFRREAAFRDCIFGSVSFEHATFLKNATFTECDFRVAVDLDRATAKHLLAFQNCAIQSEFRCRGAQLRQVHLRGLSFGRYCTFDNSSITELRINAVRFEAEARFRGLKKAVDSRFRRVSFAESASFQATDWGWLRLELCSFHGPIHLENATVSTLRMNGSTVTSARAIHVEASVACEFDEVTFSRPLVLKVKAPHVSTAGAVFEMGVDLQLAASGQLDLSRASLLQTSVITTAEPFVAGTEAYVDSVAGARIENLILRDLDLKRCLFSKAHSLTNVLIDGRDQLDVAPLTHRFAKRREVLFDEWLYRHNKWIANPWTPVLWRLNEPHPTEAVATGALAESYRALRRARESAHDAPGASDFYYGEMEARRRGAAGHGERAILTAYWLLSGYGMRVSRALVAYVLVVAILTLLLLAGGLQQDEGIGAVLAYVLATTTVLARPTTAVHLTTFGSYIEVLARLSGPVLFGLAVLALRARVKR